MFIGGIEHRPIIKPFKINDLSTELMKWLHSTKNQPRYRTLKVQVDKWYSAHQLSWSWLTSFLNAPIPPILALPALTYSSEVATEGGHIVVTSCWLRGVLVWPACTIMVHECRRVEMLACCIQCAKAPHTRPPQSISTPLVFIFIPTAHGYFT